MNLVASMLSQSRWATSTTWSVAPEAMAASSSSVMSMARLNCVVSVLLNVGALP